MKRVQGLYILNPNAYHATYGLSQRSMIERYMTEVGPQQTSQSILQHSELLEEIDVLMSGWGAPVIDDHFLAKAPKLRAIFYAAGAIGSWATDAVWKRGLTVSSASAANAIPVAEYTFAMIILGLKKILPMLRRPGSEPDIHLGTTVPGNFSQTVGLVSYGLIARKLYSLLRATELKVVVYDPFLSEAEAERSRVEKVGLDELFERSQAVSLHTPLLPETAGMITAQQLSRMRRNSVLINTARGGLIKQDELVEIARVRQDVQFILDVTTPEPLPADSPIHSLQNVFVTPHIAGSVGQECERMGQYMADELKRYVQKRPLLWSVDPSNMKFTAHNIQRL